MKKILITLAIMMFGFAFATTDSEIRAQRAVKQIKAKAINNEINKYKSELETVVLDTKTTNEEKSLKEQEIQKKLSELYAQREQNAKDYREFKKQIKSGK